jgi:hypothetical protein
MYVPSYPRVLALLLMLACCAGAAQAVEFDERLKAPLVKEPAVLRTQAQSYVAKFNALQASPQELISNRALAGERFDLAWQIQRAIDVHRPLGDLSAVGLKAQEDGSYRIDYNASPQWKEPGDLLPGWLSDANWEIFGKQLIERGFRAEDIAALKEYVVTHDLQRTSRLESLPLAVSFSKVVKKYDKIKRPVDDAMVLSYLYQLKKTDAERSRAWVEGLISSVDAQGQRILLAYFDEMKWTGVWGPSDQRAGIDELLRRMRLPDFEQLALAEATGAAP